MRKLMYNTYETKQIEYLLDQYGTLIGLERKPNESLDEYKRRIIGLNVIRPNHKFDNLNHFLKTIFGGIPAFVGRITEPKNVCIENHKLIVKNEMEVEISSIDLKMYTIEEAKAFLSLLGVEIIYADSTLDNFAAIYLMPFNTLRKSILTLGSAKKYNLNPMVGALLISSKKTLTEVTSIEDLAAHCYYIDKTNGVIIFNEITEGTVYYEYFEKQFVVFYSKIQINESKLLATQEESSLEYPSQQVINIINDNMPIDIWR